MLVQLLILITGLGLLLFGGDLIVRGASALAKSLGVSPLIIGLTVVAFGTSAPELSVNLAASFNGNTEISFGNIIGSNIANIALIIGVAALMKPLVIQGIIISREIPMMLLASVIALITGMDMFLRHAENVFDRSDGLVLLLLFCVFMFYTMVDVLRKREPEPFLSDAEMMSERSKIRSVMVNLLIFFAGLVLLILGGKISVSSAVTVAEMLHVPKLIIGLTIIAIGTSLPELVTSVMATLKGQTDIAMGNIVGSNIFNLLFVNGICSTLKPIPVPPGGHKDLLMMVFLSFLLLPLCMTSQKTIRRSEGALLLSLYFGFTLWRILAG